MASPNPTPDAFEAARSKGKIIIRRLADQLTAANERERSTKAAQAEIVKGDRKRMRLLYEDPAEVTSRISAKSAKTKAIDVHESSAHGFNDLKASFAKSENWKERHGPRLRAFPARPPTEPSRQQNPDGPAAVEATQDMDEAASSGIRRAEARAYGPAIKAFVIGDQGPGLRGTEHTVDIQSLRGSGDDQRPSGNHDIGVTDGDAGYLAYLPAAAA
ncbi:hypothetical protein F4859DRAFT_517577 [Xylaria cf. heliscus]|nr:hypothetical protein F4859DRAFT_517577 [Xylaria cf. heliscus]